MTDREKLISLCNQGFKGLGLDPADYQDRLNDEIREIDAQNEFQYFLDMADKKIRHQKNENNLLVPYLLGIVFDYDHSGKPEYIYGEFPDIDTDYNPLVRDYLKNVWAPKEYGVDKVCSIGSYNSFGIKSALIDMARVHGKSRSEILDLTTKLGLKDDDGKALTWDKALEEYPDLKKYCEDNPDVARAAKKLLHRNRGMGKHAGGLIISSVPIADFVPLVKDKNGTQLSAWVEGLHGQDLGPVGLIKFDLLVITNLMQIAKACKFIKERHGLKNICAKPGNKDWSDTSYLNDEKAIALAKKADLKCIFQFDSEGIRAMVKSGGVDNFNDLVAYSSLYRPGPMAAKAPERYAARKRGQEQYEIHPLLEKSLRYTYGLMIFQEQCMQVLHFVGNIPLKDCEALRKAISKKDEEKFKSYKERFVTNGVKNLGWEEAKILELWDTVQAFSGYSFNRSHAVAYTMISSRLLYLKAHYPLEFFAATLSCVDDADKVKEYKVEASRSNIEVNRLSLNDSKESFDIVDNKLYFGFGNLKGVGPEVAKRVVAGQPYVGITDFLERFGTDASVVKALISLDCFKGDHVRLYLYSEHYKDATKKIHERRQRYKNSQVKLMEELKGLVNEHDFEIMKKDFLAVNLNDWYEQVLGEDEIIEERYKSLVKLQKKWKRCIDTFARKEKDVAEGPIPFEEFWPTSYDVEPDLEKILCNKEEAEKQFYGFVWTHPLEKSPDYKGDHTFESFRMDVESRNATTAMCEVMIVSVDLKTTKKGDPFASLRVEDANSEAGFVNVWSEDLERFRPELVAGNLVKIRLIRPEPPFRNYTFESPPRHKRHNLPKHKDQDYRLVVMRKPETAPATKHRVLTDEEVNDMFTIGEI
jgi:DNA polymerase III alpha subunit